MEKGKLDMTRLQTGSYERKHTVKQRWKMIYMMHKLIKWYIKTLKMKHKTDKTYRE